LRRESDSAGPQPAPDRLIRSAGERTARRALRLVLVVLGAALGLVILLAAVDLLRIRHDLDEGQHSLTALDFKTVDERGGVVPVASDAAANLHRAAHLASSSPWLSLVSNVPGVGSQLDALRDLTGAADRVGRLGESTAQDVQAALDHASGEGPSGRVALVDQVSASVDRLQAGLRAVDVGAHGSLLAPLRTARADFVRHLDNAANRLEEGRSTLGVLRSFLAGPRRYLILGGNNAEMRSVGIATTAGAATIDNGSVKVGDFYNAGQTRLAQPGVPLPEGWDWLFGYLDVNIEFGNMVASPNFPLTGTAAAAGSATTLTGPVDGVIYVDTVSLQNLLSVVGPVTVDGVTYDGTNAARILINENYLDFSSSDPSGRRDAQGRVAKAIFDAINTRHVSLIKLAAKLQDLAKSRHLEAWSSNPDEQKLWEDVGADGTRRPNDIVVAAEELGTSKLDYYVTEHVAMKVQTEGDHRRVSLAISLTNPPRQKTSPYIEGGTPLYAKPGEYGFYLLVYMPRSATDVIHDDPSWTSESSDGPLQATTFTARAPVGTTRTINVSFLLPNDETTINIVPSARLRPATWTIGRTSFNDLFPSSINLAAVESESTGYTSIWLVVALGLFALGAALAGDAWGRAAVERADGRHVSPRAQFDANVGWWLMAASAAILAAQIVIYASG
jgi:hypothetical protein